jgi:phosphohistidine phosphatase SixA
VSGRLLVVRHASAGDRSAWIGDDRLRPLDDRGLAQARWLRDELSASRPTRVISSPYARCTQTVAPLAETIGVDVEERLELAEGSSSAALAPLLAELRDLPAAVLCSHGDVIGDLVHSGRCKKGSIWVLEWQDGIAVPSGYIKPPV